MRPPLRSPTVVRSLQSLTHHFRVHLVGCCVHLSIGGRLKQQRILIYSFFAPKSDGQKGVMAFSPIVFALRAASPEYYTPTIRPAFSWLLRLSMQQEPSQSEAPSPSLFSFFRRSVRHTKRWANVLPHAFRPCASPLQCPTPTDTIVRLVVASKNRAAAIQGQCSARRAIFRWAPFRQPKEGDQT